MVVDPDLAQPQGMQAHPKLRDKVAEPVRSCVTTTDGRLLILAPFVVGGSSGRGMANRARPEIPRGGWGWRVGDSNLQHERPENGTAPKKIPSRYIHRVSAFPNILNRFCGH
jgi:hypothetical protein